MSDDVEVFGNVMEVTAMATVTPTRATRRSSTTVRVQFSGAIDPSSVAIGDFAISGNTVASVVAGGNYVDVALDDPVAVGDEIEVDGVLDSETEVIAEVTLSVLAGGNPLLVPGRLRWGKLGRLNHFGAGV